MEQIAYLIAAIQGHQILAYFILFLGGYFDTLIGPGFFVQGEIFFLSGAILAGMGYLNIFVVYLVLVLGGVLGDHSSYFIGRYYGKRIKKWLFNNKNKYLNNANYNKGKKFFRNHGSKSIYLARLMGPVSWITPFLAGFFKTKWKTFAKYNLLGVMVGIGNFVALGFLIGAAYLKIYAALKNYFLIILIVLIALSFLLYYLSKKSKKIKLIKTKLLSHFMEYAIIYTLAYIITYITILYFIFSF